MTSDNRRSKTPRLPRFNVSWAYRELRKAGTGVFPAHLRDEVRLDWAFKKAREIDRGHELEYPEGDDPSAGDYLKSFVYENVRMWAEKDWLKR